MYALLCKVLVLFGSIVVPDPNPHHSDKLNPDPYQSDKLDQDPDPYPFADYKPKCMEYESI
jgi:hypothetical protein